MPKNTGACHCQCRAVFIGSRELLFRSWIFLGEQKMLGYIVSLKAVSIVVSRWSLAVLLSDTPAMSAMLKRC